MRRRRSYKPVLATQYSAFPAIIVVQEEDDGRQMIMPIPVTGTILLRWLWLWWFLLSKRCKGLNS